MKNFYKIFLITYSSKISSLQMLNDLFIAFSSAKHSAGNIDRVIEYK